MTSSLINRNITTLHGRSSMRLEPEVWSAITEICHRQGVTLAQFVQQVEGAHSMDEGTLSSAVRVAVLEYYRAAATEAGHTAAGHGPLDEVDNQVWQEARRIADARMEARR